MRSIDLIEFIKEGRLGHITLSSSKDEIRRVFGQPKHVSKWGEGGNLAPIAWVYHDLYFGFHKDTGETECIGIQSANFKKLEANIGIARIECHGLRNSIEVDEFEELVAGYDAFPTDKIRWDSNGWVLTFSSGIEVSFQEQLDGQPTSGNCHFFCGGTAKKAPVTSGGGCRRKHLQLSSIV